MNDKKTEEFLEKYTRNAKLVLRIINEERKKALEEKNEGKEGEDSAEAK